MAVTLSTLGALDQFRQRFQVRHPNIFSCLSGMSSLCPGTGGIIILVPRDMEDVDPELFLQAHAGQVTS